MDCTEVFFNSISALTGFGTLVTAAFAGFCAWKAWQAQENQVETQRQQLAVMKEERDAAREERTLLQAQVDADRLEREATIRARTPVFDFAEKRPKDLATTALQHLIHRKAGVLDRTIEEIIEKRGPREIVHVILIFENTRPGTVGHDRMVDVLNAQEGVSLGNVLRARQTKTDLGEITEVYTLDMRAWATHFQSKLPIDFLLRFQTGGGDQVQKRYRYKLGERRLEIVD
jgi:hypothetical protein